MTRNTMVKKKKESKPATVDGILAVLNKKYSDTVHMGGDIKRSEPMNTGSIILDKALDGGFIRGKIIECYGPESSGKTALAYSFLSKCDGIKAFIDGESAYDVEMAEFYNVDVSQLIVQQPEYIEQGMEMTLDLVDQGVEAIVFDSIAGIPAKVELEGDMEDHSVGKKATRMSQLMRKLHRKAAINGTTVFFINQIRDSMKMFGSPWSTPGGHGLKFHATYRLGILSTPKIKTGDKIYGHYMNMVLKKNKFGAPETRLSIPLIYGHGIPDEWAIMEMCTEAGILTKSGSWYKYKDDSIAQGDYNCFTFLLDNPEFCQELKNQLEI